jgi:hypothetical protein
MPRFSPATKQWPDAVCHAKQYHSKTSQAMTYEVMTWTLQTVSGDTQVL